MHGCKAVGDGTNNHAGDTDKAHAIVNNFLTCGAQCLLSGGAAAVITPTSIEWRNNYGFRPLTWDPANPSYNGGVASGTSVHRQERMGAEERRPRSHGRQLHGKRLGGLLAGRQRLYPDAEEPKRHALPAVLCYQCDNSLQLGQVLRSDFPDSERQTATTPMRVGGRSLLGP
jgi:hypothetical protein